MVFLMDYYSGNFYYTAPGIMILYCDKMRNSTVYEFQYN
jgi:hypothetical protein